MLTLRKTTAAAGLQLLDLPAPTAADLAPGEVLVRVRAAGICGSDLHVDDWTPSYAFITRALPVTLGHEFVGVAETGPLAGRRVVVRPSVTCGVCPACTAGRPDDCETRTGLGMTRDGAFAPWVRVPQRNCVPVPEGMGDGLAALTEPITIALQALRIGCGEPVGEPDLRGRRVLVMGPGTIGQGIAVLARRAGAAQVVVSGFDDAARLDVLRRMGFEACVDVASHSLAEATRPHTGGAHFDLVFEATGVPHTIAEALPLLRRNGVLVVAGIHARPLQLDLAPFVRRQQQLRASFRPPESDWPRALALMAELGEQMAPMVSHVLPLSRALQGFTLARGKQASKVLLCPEPGPPAQPWQPVAAQ
ncbi:MAG: hypothetical protein RIQ60_298 [Pseudomonadota bacterium]|jgi:threonine dehydrogenase-like Zn-dependent dehydrogenase